jgi:hypothetical protein
MWDHVEDVHLRHISADARIICHHPVCKRGCETVKRGDPGLLEKADGG